MVAVVRVAAGLVGLLLFAGLLSLIWWKFNPNPGFGIILSVLALFVSILTAALFGEHFLNFLTRKGR